VPQGCLLRCRLGLGEDNDDDDPVQSPQLRPRRHRRRPPCGTDSHR